MNLLYLIILITASVLFSCLQYASNYKGKVYVLIIVGLSILLILNNDWNSLPDITGYLANFDIISLNSSILHVQPNYYGFEPGFMGLSLIIKRIWNNHGFYLCTIFMINFVCIYLTGKALYEMPMAGGKKNRNLIASRVRGVSRVNTIDEERTVFYSALFMSLWIGYFGLFYGMAVLRAGLSMSLCFYGLVNLYKKSYVRAAIALVLAFFIQTFCIIIIVAALFTYKFVKIKNKKIYYIWWLICVALWLSRISLFLASLINSITLFISNYIIRFAKFGLFYNVIAGNGFLSKKNLMFLIMSLFFIYCKPEDDRENDLVLNIFMVGLTFTYLTNEFVMGYRISDMFFIFSIPLAYKLIAKNYKFNFSTKLVLMALMIVVPTVIAARAI